MRFWKISGDTDNPKGNRSQRYLPYGVENVVKRLDCSSRTQCQKPDRRSTMENTLAWASSGKSSSRIGIWYVSRLRALLRGLGSTQIRSAPDFFVVTTKLLTQGVGCSTGFIISSATSLFNSSLNGSFKAVGIRRDGIITGCTSGSTSRCTVPGNVPTGRSNTSENLRTNSSADVNCFTLASSWLGGVAVTKFSLCTVNNFICWAALAPISGMRPFPTTTNSTEYFFLFCGLRRISLAEPRGVTSDLFHIKSALFVGVRAQSPMRSCVMTLIDAPQSIWNLIALLSISIIA